MCGCGRAQEALEDERAARVEAEALAERLRQQLTMLRDAQTRQQRSSQERLSALQAHLQSLASRVVRLCSSRLFQYLSSSRNNETVQRHACVSMMVTLVLLCAVCKASDTDLHGSECSCLRCCLVPRIQPQGKCGPSRAMSLRVAMRLSRSLRLRKPCLHWRLHPLAYNKNSQQSKHRQKGQEGRASRRS